MSENLYEAHRQWATRPADESFANLQDLLSCTQRQKSNSLEVLRQMDDLKLGITSDGGITLNGNLSQAYLTNWSFGQLSRTIGAPASYLKKLSPYLARECVHYGLSKTKEESKILIRDRTRNGMFEKYASAFTSPSYGRIWDADVVESLMQAVDGTSWQVPNARQRNRSQHGGLYASDHDVFAFFVNDENPFEVGDAKLGRGFFCWNSETGASTFGLTTFLYNYVCGNHIVWGAEDVKELKIFHRSHAPDRFYSLALPVLNRFVENPVLEDRIKSTAEKAMKTHIGDKVKNTIEWFKNKPFTNSEIENAWRKGISEGQKVSNLWGMVQGLTAYARDMEFIDKRVNLERRAGALLRC